MAVIRGPTELTNFGEKISRKPGRLSLGFTSSPRSMEVMKAFQIAGKNVIRADYQARFCVHFMTYIPSPSLYKSLYNKHHNITTRPAMSVNLISEYTV